MSFIIHILLLFYAALFAAITTTAAALAVPPISPNEDTTNRAYAPDLINTLPQSNLGTSTLNKREYQWTCDNLNLKLADIRVCMNYLQLAIPKSKCVANPGDDMCHNGGAYITGLSYTGGKVVVRCKDAGDAVQFIFNNCGARGGSAVANHNGNFIVHVSDHWIDSGI